MSADGPKNYSQSSSTSSTNSKQISVPQTLRATIYGHPRLDQLTDVMERLHQHAQKEGKNYEVCVSSLSQPNSKLTGKDLNNFLQFVADDLIAKANCHTRSEQLTNFKDLIESNRGVFRNHLEMLIGVIDHQFDEQVVQSFNFLQDEAQDVAHIKQLFNERLQRTQIWDALLQFGLNCLDSRAKAQKEKLTVIMVGHLLKDLLLIIQDVHNRLSNNLYENHNAYSVYCCYKLATEMLFKYAPIYLEHLFITDRYLDPMVEKITNAFQAAREISILFTPAKPQEFSKRLETAVEKYHKKLKGNKKVAPLIARAKEAQEKIKKDEEDSLNNPVHAMWRRVLQEIEDLSEVELTADELKAAEGANFPQACSALRTNVTNLKDPELCLENVEQLFKKLLELMRLYRAKSSLCVPDMGGILNLYKTFVEKTSLFGCSPIGRVVRGIIQRIYVETNDLLKDTIEEYKAKMLIASTKTSADDDDLSERMEKLSLMEQKDSADVDNSVASATNPIAVVTEDVVVQPPAQAILIPEATTVSVRVAHATLEAVIKPDQTVIEPAAPTAPAELPDPPALDVPAVPPAPPAPKGPTTQPTKSQQEQELENIKVKRETELAQLKAKNQREQEAKRRENNKKFNAERARLESEHQAAMALERATQKTELARIEAEQKTALANLPVEMAAELSTLKATHKQQREELSAANKAARQTAKQPHEAKIQAQTRSHEATLRSMRHTHEVNLARDKANGPVQLAELQRKHKAIEAAEAQKLREIEAEEKAKHTSISFASAVKAQQEHTANLQALTVEHQNNMAAIKAVQEAAQAAQKAAEEKNLAAETARKAALIGLTVPIPSLVKMTLKYWRSEEIQFRIFGGYLRDAYRDHVVAKEKHTYPKAMKSTKKDIDIVVDLTPEQFLTKFPGEATRPFPDLNLCKVGDLDVWCEPFTHDIKAFLRNRDLTQNVLTCTENGELEDYLGIKDTFTASHLQMPMPVTDSTFIKNPPLMFRMLRFQTQLGQEIEDKDLHQMRLQGKKAVSLLPYSRYTGYMESLLKGATGVKNLQFIINNGLLAQLVPASPPQYKDLLFKYNPYLLDFWKQTLTENPQLKGEKIVAMLSLLAYLVFAGGNQTNIRNNIFYTCDLFNKEHPLDNEARASLESDLHLFLEKYLKFVDTKTTQSKVKAQMLARIQEPDVTPTASSSPSTNSQTAHTSAPVQQPQPVPIPQPLPLPTPTAAPVAPAAVASTTNIINVTVNNGPVVYAYPASKQRSPKKGPRPTMPNNHTTHISTAKK